MTRGQMLELAAGIAILGAAVGGAAYWSRATPGGRPAAFAVTRPAEPLVATDFELVDLAGRTVRLSDFRGRVVLVNFWATWCAPCREEMPALETLSKDLAPHGLTVVAVNHKEAKSVIETFLREGKLTIPVVLDKDGRVAERYQVYALPATFIVNRHGKVVATVLGSRDWVGPDARDYLGRLLNEPEA
jgi:thiol-disulfide isomerase/thioredoxin